MPAWRLTDPDIVALRAFDAEAVVYNDATGDTHYLDPLGSALLRALIERPEGRSTDELAAMVGAAFEAPDGAALTAAVDGALREFEAIRLVRPASS